MRRIVFKIALFFLGNALFFSCASKPKNQKDDNEVVFIEEEVEPESKFSQQEEDFLLTLKNIEISVENYPSQTSVNKDFKSDFIFKITDLNKNPLSNFSIKLTYPKTNTEIGEIISKTDENGIFNFSCPTPLFGADDKIYFSPYIDSENEEILSAIKEKTISAPYKVRNNFGKNGVLLFVWDYNEKNKPINNSYDLLSKLRGKGISLSGNAPINETSYYEKTLSEIYKANYEIVGNSYEYLIVGTVKFTKPVEPQDNQYLCSLISEINIIKMKTGEKVYTNTFTNESLGKNWTQCVTKCKDELADKIVDSIIFNNKF